MNNKEFIAELSQRTGYTVDDSQKMVNSVIESMGDHFLDDDTVLVPTFGTFEVKKKMERVMVNPSTGQRMLVPPKLVLNFKPNVGWKERVKQATEISDIL
jgi:DNA-binding protein HU-beta/integration host factor subunit alpha